jgi:chromatin segregation and condensation protein Rec8/ScpA/Scc1 (kleisin family)
MGLGEGLIFTGDRIVEALEETAEMRERERLEAQSKQDAKMLKKEAKAWMEAAVARQKEAHARLIEEWKAKPTNSRTRRQPAKPTLDTVPEAYVDALKTKKRKPRKPVAVSESETETDSYHSDYEAPEALR